MVEELAIAKKGIESFTGGLESGIPYDTALLSQTLLPKESLPGVYNHAKAHPPMLNARSDVEDSLRDLPEPKSNLENAIIAHPS